MEIEGYSSTNNAKNQKNPQVNVASAAARLNRSFKWKPNGEPMTQEETKIDDLVKSRKVPFSVIPVPHRVRDKLQPESSIFN